MAENIFDSFTPWETSILITILVSIVVSIIIGNSLVLLAILTQKSLQTPANVYLMSLALVDLSVGVFVLPLNILQLINKQWNYGSFLCGFWLTADVTLCTLSIYHIIAIAVDRYRAVNEGIHYVQQRSFKSVLLTIAFLWVISIWISTPPLLGWNKNDWGEMGNLNKDRNDTLRIECQLTTNQGYVLHSAFGTLVFPMFLMVAIYVQIYYKIRTRLRERSKVQGLCREKSKSAIDPDNSEAGTDNESTEDFLEKVEVAKKESMFSLNAKRIKRISRSRSVVVSKTCTVDESLSNSKINRDAKVKGKSLPLKIRPTSQIQEFIQKKLKFSLTKERRAARTLGIIISAFITCWLPFCILYIVGAFIAEEYKSNIKIWFDIFTWLGYTNSAINPIIYSVYNQEFKKAFKKIVCCCRSSRISL